MRHSDTQRPDLEKPSWGAPKIQGEIAKPSFVVSERTVARYLGRIRRRGNSDPNWLTFLRNHREAIAVFDFFTAPTGIRLLYCLFVIEHGRRTIPHCNVTARPDSEWAIQQLREAFPGAGAYRYVIIDRDDKFDAEVVNFLKDASLKPKKTSIRSPWQNGISERWVGGCRRELLDHVIPLNERHLRRLLWEYIDYFQNDRIHDSPAKDTPRRRPGEKKPNPGATAISSPRLGGLHHRYFRSEAA